MSEPNFKTCRTCLIPKPTTREYFYPSNAVKPGIKPTLRKICKKCYNRMKKPQKNTDKDKERRRQYYLKNKAKILANAQEKRNLKKIKLLKENGDV